MQIQGKMPRKNVRGRRCDHPGAGGNACSKHPIFGLEGTRRATRCTAHADAGMVNMKRKKQCDHEDGCTKRPTFGFEGGGAVRCAAHKEVGMVNLQVGKTCAC